MTTSPDPHRPAGPVPAPLRLAALLAALEGVVLAGYGLTLAASLDSRRPEVGLSALLFLVVYGGFLVWCARELVRRRSWARAPVVLAQLIQILVGAGFWGGSTSVVALVAVPLGVLTLVGVFHPASLAALDG